MFGRQTQDVVFCQITQNMSSMIVPTTGASPVFSHGYFTQRIQKTKPFSLICCLLEKKFLKLLQESDVEFKIVIGLKIFGVLSFRLLFCGFVYVVYHKHRHVPTWCQLFSKVPYIIPFHWLHFVLLFFPATNRPENLVIGWNFLGQLDFWQNSLEKCRRRQRKM